MLSAYAIRTGAVFDFSFVKQTLLELPFIVRIKSRLAFNPFLNLSSTSFPNRTAGVDDTKIDRKTVDR